MSSTGTRIALLMLLITLLVAAYGRESIHPDSPISMSAMGEQFVADEYTLALWHFDEGMGQVVHDESAHQNDGQLGPTLGVDSRDPSWTTGFTGQPGDYALSFDDWYDYVNVTDNPDDSLDLLQGDEFTIEFWTFVRNISRPDRGNGHQWNTFIAKRAHEDPTGYIITQCSYYPKLSAYFYDDTSTIRGVGSGPTSTLQWVHVMFTYDGQYSRLYFDGVPQNVSEVGHHYVSGNSQPLSIGKSLAGDEPWRDSVDCIIDEVRISSIARAPIRPEFVIQELNFDPESPAPVGTSTSVTAEIRNYGICSAELWHGHMVTPPNDNNEWMECYFNQNLSNSEFMRLRARNNGTNARVNIWINETGPMGEELVRHAEFIVNSTRWTTYESMGTHIITAGDHRVRINLVNGEYSEVGIDWLQIGDVHIEAETYVGMGGNDDDPDNRGVDKIRPGNVIVNFYDAIPAGQVMINGDVIIGDTNYINPNITPMKYVKNGGTASAEVNWTAYPAGDHNITVDVRPDPNPRSNLTRVFRATAELRMTRTAGGSTDPVTGTHIYPEGEEYCPPPVKVTVTAIPWESECELDGFYYWIIGVSEFPSNPRTVTVDSNTRIHAVFRFSGIPCCGDYCGAEEPPPMFCKSIED